MEEDKAVAKAEQVPAGAEDACRDAAQQCPVEAIKIEE
jgi:ferredoxin